MTNMTSDLYYTQLCEMNNFNISDKRVEITLTSEPVPDTLSKTNLSFYAVIDKKENSNKWTATLYLVDNIKNVTKKETKEYDSYYKILMEPKNTLQESLKNLLENKATVVDNSDINIPDFDSQNASVSTEFLSGNWASDTENEFIDKIVIMRGGRGFIVFQNGATMNISLEIVNTDGIQKLLITQKGRTNASYYPELSRQIALQEAVTAEPIKWIFSLSSNDKLNGTKETLIENDGTAKPGTVQVCWTRKS